MKFLTSFLALFAVVAAGAITPEEDLYGEDVPTLSPRVAPVRLNAPTVVKGERWLSSTQYPTIQTGPSGPPVTKTQLCFSGPTTVQVQQTPTAAVKTVEMRDLQVGDQVLSSSCENKYQKVYAFAHHEPAVEAEFLQFKSGKENVLEVTADHLVYIEGQKYPVRAGSIRVGDSLVTTTSIVTSKIITYIDTVTRTGLYAPLTPDGTLVVNAHQIKASNYATPIPGDDAYYDPQMVEFEGGISSGISQQTMTHLLLTPLRVLCMGMAPQWCQNDVLLTPEGKPAYIAMLLDLATFARFHFPAVLQALLMAGFVILLAPLAMVEFVVGPFLAPAVVALIGLAGYLYKTNNRNRNNGNQKIKSV